VMSRRKGENHCFELTVNSQKPLGLVWSFLLPGPANAATCA
jgi:hypothetical protein